MSAPKAAGNISVSRSWVEDAQAELEKLRAENTRLQGELQRARGETTSAEVVRLTGENTRHGEGWSKLAAWCADALAWAIGKANEPGPRDTMRYWQGRRDAMTALRDVLPEYQPTSDNVPFRNPGRAP